MKQNEGVTAEAEISDAPPDRGVDMPALQAYFASTLPDAAGATKIRQFSGGNANLHYLIETKEHAYVLRRPPFGKLAPGAHDMGREYRVLHRLRAVYRLAPKVFLYCEDASVIGAPFLVMEYLPSVVIRRELPRELVGDRARCRKLGDTIIDALAELHAIDAQAAGLGDLGNPDGYLARQMSGWQKRWEAAADGPRADMERVMIWLSDNLPASASHALLHNDFKLDNLLLDPADLTRCIGVVDWDMCTRGDPLVELGFLLNYWGEAGDPETWLDIASMPTWQPGFPTRAEAIARYASKSGRDVSDLDWYRVFGPFKLAVILQQIWGRFQRGESTNERFKSFGMRVDGLIGKAEALIPR